MGAKILLKQTNKRGNPDAFACMLEEMLGALMGLTVSLVSEQPFWGLLAKKCLKDHGKKTGDSQSFGY